MIVVEPKGGLANRIRGVVSGMILGEELGEPVVVAWTPKPGVFPATHPQVFANSDAKTFFEAIEPVPGEEIWRVRWRHGEGTMFGRCQRLALRARPFEVPAEVLAKRAGTVRIRTPWNFKAPGTSLARYAERYADLLHRHFTPLDGGEGLADPPSHGMHIRRGDMTHIPRQRMLGGASRAGRCERAMRRILRRDPRASFLLCSDDAALKREIRERLGPRVRTLEGGPLGRDSVAAMRFAARELYALGQVGTILGDGSSTFGPTAARYRGVPYRNLSPVWARRTRRALYRGARIAADLWSD